MLYSAWCQNLKKLRESRNMRQQDIAEAIGKSRSQYCAVEQGRSVVNYIWLQALAHVFDISMAQLISMENATPRHRKKKEKPRAVRR